MWESLHGISYPHGSQGRTGICTVFNTVVTGQCCKSLRKDGYVIGAGVFISLPAYKYSFCTSTRCLLPVLRLTLFSSTWKWAHFSPFILETPLIWGCVLLCVWVMHWAHCANTKNRICIPSGLTVTTAFVITWKCTKCYMTAFNGRLVSKGDFVCAFRHLSPLLLFPYISSLLQRD